MSKVKKLYEWGWETNDSFPVCLIIQMEVQSERGITACLSRRERESPLLFQRDVRSSI